MDGRQLEPLVKLNRQVDSQPPVALWRMKHPRLSFHFSLASANARPDHATRDAFSMDMDRHNQAEQGDELHDETRAGVKSPSSPNEGEQRNDQGYVCGLALVHGRVGSAGTLINPGLLR